MNRMEEVTKMFGKKLWDVFIIRLGDGKGRVAYFSEEGLHVDGALRFIVSDTALKELLTGEAEILEDKADDMQQLLTGKAEIVEE